MPALTLLRPRFLPFLALILTIAAGLAVRAALSGFWAKYLGVGLWAVAAYVATLCVTPRLPPPRTATIALVISWGVELAQLTPIPGRLSSVHPFVRLIFGEFFSPYDLIALAIGVLAAWAAHTAARRPPAS